MTNSPKQFLEFTLLGLLALLWGSSYLFIKVAVAEIPPLTLIAARVLIAAIFLFAVMKLARLSLPRDPLVWRMLMIQAFFNSIGAWTVLAWGQQFVGAGLASVLNSTSPIFVFMLTLFLTRHESVNLTTLSGVLLGMTGVVILVGTEALDGFGRQVSGQLACLVGALLYACAAIYGKRFHSLNAVTTATGTMICASIVLVPLALSTEHSWTLEPSGNAIAATIILSVFCTGVALLLYFRLVRTLGSMGVTSQAYLRSGVGVLLGIVFLGESLSASMVIGLGAAIAGVAMINWPIRK
ncbi:MAG: EamA family transporter [Candidatus Competibacteraceae bacterium]|nr:EamA family transporter [Caldilineaceae bacterium]MCB1815439.1 EamA family transporter [Candidatus Competibacteraceae bacterium]